MDESIPLVLSKVTTCLTNEACIYAVEKLSDKVTGLSELPEKLEEMRYELIMFSQYVRELELDYSMRSDAVAMAWIRELQKMTLRIEDMMDKYLHHAVQLQQEGTKLWTIKGEHYGLLFGQLCVELTETENEMKQLSDLKPIA